MKTQIKIISILLCMCICLLCVSCNKEPKAEISFLSRAEAGVSGGAGNGCVIVASIFQPKGNEVEMMTFHDVEIVVATVVDHEAFTQSAEASPYNYGFSAVMHIVEVTDVLLGNCSVGEKLYVGLEAQVKDGVYYASYRTETGCGGFIEKGTQLLLFVMKNMNFTEYYGEDFKYRVVIPANEYSSTRIVNEDGTLGYLEGNVRATEAAFAQYQTVEEVRAALPQIFETYRDTYKKDHPLIATYRAAPNAEPSIPEGYIPYAELPETAK